MALILVPHLDPDHASILTAILQRITTLPVVEAEDQMPVAANNVYVIPPNREMSISQGVLQLKSPERPRGQRMPIDAFLRSLGEDQRENAIGVILSGTGTDGTQGLGAILSAGGISYVQEPETAKYSGMPENAIRSGYAMHVLPVGRIPAALLARSDPKAARTESLPAANGDLKRILMLLRSGTGHDFSQYKKSTMRRRIERRMAQHDIENSQIYARYLKEHPAEVHLLLKELLINVTSFFRDPDAFAALRTEVLPQLLEGKPPGYVFRVWVPGCATGEEAYSIAILLSELMEEAKQDFRVQIYSTDLAEEAITFARAGLFPHNIAQDVGPGRLRRFFVKHDAGYQVKKSVREMVVFAIQNVVKDPPFTRLDLICCRNLMIYLEPELQNVLISTFHYALKPDGMLFLSPSESVGNHSDLFIPLNRKWKIYRAIDTASSARMMLAGRLSGPLDREIYPPIEALRKSRETNFSELAKRTLLQLYAPASVVTDLAGNILYVYGETGRFLRPAPGQATLNVIEMARDGVQGELRSAILSAAGQNVATVNREVSVRMDDEFYSISFSVRPILGPSPSQHVLLVSFQAIQPQTLPRSKRRGQTSSSASSRRVEDLERDLAQTRENLQAIIEGQQSSNEELKSTNEEIQSTNEELQSTNEELETSREELQSVNEELLTVNAELQAKIEELADMQNDMKNLLDNINVGTIFLDQNLVIRRFTREATRAYRLVDSDVGRPLADIKSDVEDIDLVAEARNVLDTLVPYEREVKTSNSLWFLIRIQPYRTLDNVIQGVVLTFTDIRKRVEAEAAIQEARELAEGIVDTVREPLVVLDSNLRVVSASRSFYQFFHVTVSDVVGNLIYELGNGQWNLPKLRDLMESVLPQNENFDGFEVEYEVPGEGCRTLLLNARRIIRKGSSAQFLLLAIEVQPRGEK